MNLDLPGDSSRREAIAWLKRLIRDMGPGFHLDSVSADHVWPDGQPVLTREQCLTVTRSLERLFAILGDERPYEIGAEVIADQVSKPRVETSPPLSRPQFSATAAADRNA